MKKRKTSSKKSKLQPKYSPKPRKKLGKILMADITASPSPSLDPETPSPP